MPNRFCTALAAALLLSSVSSVHAQIPSLLPGKSLAPAKANAPKETVVVDLNKELADTQLRLGETQGVVNRLQLRLKQTNLSTEARNDLLKQFNQRQTLADRYAQQIDTLKQLQLFNQKIIDATQQRDGWVAPTGNPPWPITEGDLVKNTMVMQESRIAQLNREINALTEQVATYGREKD